MMDRQVERHLDRLPGGEARKVWMRRYEALRSSVSVGVTEPVASKLAEGVLGGVAVGGSDCAFCGCGCAW